MSDLLSKKTRSEFCEFFVNDTLREIEIAFDAFDVPRDTDYEPNTSGQRRRLVQQYYHAVDFTDWGHVRRVLQVYASVLERLEKAVAQDAGLMPCPDPARTLASLKKWLERDGFIYQAGTITPVGKHLHLPEVKHAAAAFDAPELHRQIDRIAQAVDSDPALAIGTAKELVETTCRTILQARGVPVDAFPDVSALVRETRKALRLLPEDIPDTAKGADTIRKLLSNLGTLAQTLGELRNLYGTGHGRCGQSKGLEPRHARLAVGAAATLATFLFETHESRPSAKVKTDAAS